jgi:hypothetical protein
VDWRNVKDWVCLGTAILLIGGCRAHQSRFAFDAPHLVPRDERTRPWVLAGEPQVYDRDNLYEYLDGQAQTYLDYGMHSCIHAEYHHQTQPEQRMTLDLFQFADAVGAYGLASSMRSGQAEPLEIGAVGYWQDGKLHWVRGRVYARVIAPHERLAGYSAAVYLAMVADGKMSLPATLPAELLVLPRQNRIVGSEMFLARDMLGHDFLGAGWMTTFRSTAGPDFQLFWIPTTSVEQASDRFDRLRQFASEAGSVFDVPAEPGQKAMLVIGKYSGRLLVVQQAADIAGTVDCLDDKQGAALIHELLGRATAFRAQRGESAGTAARAD